MNKILLKEIVNVIAGQSPESIYYNNNGDGMPFLQGNRTFGRLYPFIDTWTNKITKRANAGDILISVRAPVGDLNISNQEICIGRGIAALAPKNVSNRFVFYCLKYNLKTLLSSSSGTTFSSVNRSDLENLELVVPEKKNWEQIIKILSALDDKIEINNKINAELEAMAKTLYDYWFVQFEFPITNESHPELVSGSHPKGYKSAGGKMVYNPTLKREIPEGWEVKELNEIAKVIMGQSPKGESYNEEGNGVLLINGAADYEGNYLKPRIYTSAPTRLCEVNDLVFCIRATIGKLTYAEDKFCLGRGVAGVRVNSLNYTEYIFYSLNQEIERFKKNASGSIIVGITKEDLTDYNVLIPRENILNNFHKILHPIHCKMRMNSKQNQELSQLRDWLLPMLMNGQVTVEDVADEVLGMVAEPFVDYKTKEDAKENRFALWLSSQKLAARGDIDEVVLREIFDAMDDEDQ